MATDIAKKGLAGGRDLWANMHNILLMPLNILVKEFLPQSISNSGQTVAFLMGVQGMNLALSAAQTVKEVTGKYVSVEALLSELLFITSKPSYYKFMINPSNVRFAHQKLQMEEETSDLTVINTYRNKAVPLSFTGVSGCTLPKWLLQMDAFKGSIPRESVWAHYPKLSAAWVKFRQLERFYLEHDTDVVILYDMDLYIGKFVNFNYSQDAQNPWVINYDIQFKIYPDLMIHLLSVSDYAAFWTALYDRYGRTFVGGFAGKSNTVEGVISEVTGFA